MRSFRPPHPVAVLATALLVAVCVWLGYWQLDRAREKQALIDGFRRGDATSVDITSRSLDGLARYQAVNARGAYEPRRQILLDNMPAADGRPGYRVLTPFRRTTGGALLLVDRGWVPLGDSREQLPAVDVPDDAREITGRVDRPPVPGLRMRDAVAADPRSLAAGDELPRRRSSSQRPSASRSSRRSCCCTRRPRTATSASGSRRCG